MGYGHERGQEGASVGRSSPGVVRLFSQMLLLPFTVFVYGMELFVRTVRGMQQAADQGMDVMVGEAARPVTGVPAGENQFTDKRAVSGGAPPPAHTQGGWGDLKVHTTISTGDGTTGEAAEATHKEIEKMRDKDLSDDQLKLVRYKILFVKRDYEAAFPEREEVVVLRSIREAIDRLPRIEGGSYTVESSGTSGGTGGTDTGGGYSEGTAGGGRGYSS